MAISDADRVANQRVTIAALQAIVDAQARRLDAARAILSRRAARPSSTRSLLPWDLSAEQSAASETRVS